MFYRFSYCMDSSLRHVVVLSALVVMTVAGSAHAASVIGPIAFPSLTGPGNQSSLYESVTWTSDTTGLLVGLGTAVSITGTNNGFGNGADYNQSFHSNGLDGQDLTMIDGGQNRVNFEITGSAPLDLSFSDSFTHLLVYIGTGSGSTLTNHINDGSLRTPAGFEFVRLAGKNNNFRVSGSSAQGAIGDRVNPNDDGAQTAGVVLLRRTDGQAFDAVTLTIGGGSGGDNAQFQIAAPYSLVVPTPAALSLSIPLLIGLGGAVVWRRGWS